MIARDRLFTAGEYSRIQAGIPHFEMKIKPLKPRVQMASVASTKEKIR